MWVCLIPVSHACHIILTFEESAVTNTDLLNGHLQVGTETNRIGDVPTVEATHRGAIIIVIIVVNQLVV